MTQSAEKITVESATSPGWTSNVDAAKYYAMKQAMLQALPKEAPGITAAEMFDAVTPLLPSDHFPEGKTAGWWIKLVQLDLEVKGTVIRETTKPLRWHQAPGSSV